MSDVLEAQNTGLFDDVSERDKEIQASIWAMLFLMSELSLGFRALRDVLHTRGALQEEDEKIINELASTDERLQAAYIHIEKCFREKYGKVREAMDNPQTVTDKVENDYRGVAVDLPEVPKTTVTSSEEGA